MLEYCWLFALLLRSARYFTGVEGKWTLLPPISPPSSPIRSRVCFLFPVHYPHLPPSLSLLAIFQNDLHMYDSVPVLVVCIVCFFLDSVVDSCKFVAILVFIVLIFFKKNPFNISCNNGLVMMNYFSLTLSRKYFICPSILNHSFAG